MTQVSVQDLKTLKNDAIQMQKLIYLKGIDDYYNGRGNPLNIDPKNLFDSGIQIMMAIASYKRLIETEEGRKYIHSLSSQNDDKIMLLNH